MYKIRELPNAVMSRLAKQGSVKNYRAATPMPKNSGEQIDKLVTKVRRTKLVLVDSALSAGLGVPMPNWIGTLMLTSHRLGEAGFAKRGMLPGVGEKQKAEYEPFSVPIYVTWDDFGFNARELAAAEQNGTPLDTAAGEQAIRNDNEAIEDALINGAIAVNGMTTPGMIGAATVRQYKDNELWTAAGHDGADILTDVMNAVGDLQGMGFDGPYVIAAGTGESNKLTDDYKSATSGTIYERVLARRDIIAKILTAPKLPAGKVLVYQETNDVFDIIVGQMPAVVSYPADPSGWATDYMALACVVPRVKSNINGDTGIVLLTVV